MCGSFKVKTQAEPQGIFAGDPQQETPVTTPQQSNQQYKTFSDKQQYETTRKKYFEEFENNGQNRRTVRTMKQDGPNCGCYAAAAAIRTFVASADENALMKKKNPTAKELSDINKNREKIAIEIKDIAKGIQTIGEKKHRTVTGEFFDAECLADTINDYFASVNLSGIIQDSNENKKGNENSRELLAKAVEFKDQAEFEMIMKMAYDMNVRVLMPYFTDLEDFRPATVSSTAEKNSADSTEAEQHAPATEMDNAHWAVAKCKKPKSQKPEGAGTKKEIELETELKLYDGNTVEDVNKNAENSKMENTNRISCSSKELFKSNTYLGNEFDWNAYIQKPYVDVFADIKRCVATNKYMLEKAKMVGAKIVEEFNEQFKGTVTNQEYELRKIIEKEVMKAIRSEAAEELRKAEEEFRKANGDASDEKKQSDIFSVYIRDYIKNQKNLTEEDKENLFILLEKELKNVNDNTERIGDKIKEKKDAEKKANKQPSIVGSNIESVKLNHRLILIGRKNPNAENPEAEKPVAS